ncbi:MAG: MlaD family protein [Candidatus Tantalella remota]|nr:MlaD family protein [Candidatus Tantalella remota]
MFRDEKLEIKVGLFIGIGIFIMFLMVFSISDFYLLRKGYDIDILFDFTNGIKVNAPVRFAGVDAGEVKDIKIFYDGEAGRTRVKVDVRIEGDLRIEKDAVARINTLGLLGEQYLELSPGKEKIFLKDGDTIIGKTPVNVGEQMEQVKELVQSFTVIIKRAADGDGTLGKLLVDDTLYNDLVTIFDRIKAGEGTVGKFLTDEAVYNNLEEFTADIKAHPWKLLQKGRTSDKKKKSDKTSSGTNISPR